MECAKCGHKNSDTATVCSSCYFDLRSDKKPVQPTQQAGARPSRPVQAAQPTVGAASTPSASYLPPMQPSPGPPPPGYPAPTVYGAPPAPQQQPSAAYWSDSSCYAGFWSRVGACLLDGIIFIIPNMLIYAAFGSSMLPERVTGPNGMPTVVADPGHSMAQMVSWIVGAVYVIGLNTAYGATLGKMALGLQIVKTDGSPISLGTAIVRYVMETILGVVTIGITFLAVAFTARKQGFHDMIAGTVVIRTR